MKQLFFFFYPSDIDLALKIPIKTISDAVLLVQGGKNQDSIKHFILILVVEPLLIN